MNSAQFYDDQFVTASVLNAAITDVANSVAQNVSGALRPGLIAADAASITASGLTVSLNLSLPFQVVFGNGVIGSAHGTVDGADTQNYSVTVQPPGSGSVTIYCLAKYQRVQQNEFAIVGPPPGHPDFNPYFMPYVGYANVVDSLNISVGTAAPDNSTSFEIWRSTVAAGATGVVLDLSYQVRASALKTLPLSFPVSGQYLTMQTDNYLQGPGTYYLPSASGYNNVIVAATNASSGSLAINVYGGSNIYGSYAQAASGAPYLTPPPGATVFLCALLGQWYVIGGSAEGIGIPDIFPVVNGGTGNSTLTAHAVLLGEGTSAVAFAAPTSGNNQKPLISNGSSTDPSFSALNLAGPGVANVLPLINLPGSSANVGGGLTVTYESSGNPNGLLAGVAATSGKPPDTAWDYTGDTGLWVCTTTGTSGTATWTPAVPVNPSNLNSLSTPGSGNWTAPQDGWFFIEGWGAGGGSTASSGSTGAIAGAGSGGYFAGVRFYKKGTVVPYVVGAAGASGAYGSTGGTGGTTSWDSTMSATGGGGSSYSSVGLQGTASGQPGDISLSGSPGAPFGSTTGTGGTGGTAPRGAGGGSSGQSGAGPGIQPGGGAGGPGAATTNPGQIGGAGAIYVRY